VSALIYDIEGVEHSFGERLALNCSRLKVHPGRIVGIRGPNGAGKSTLLMIMAFLMSPTRGAVSFCGRPGQAGDVALRRQAVLLPQDPALLRRRVEANVLSGLRMRRLPEENAAAPALELVGLDPGRYLKRWWWELSGGESHRVALAARLALDPVALLLDEPTASLDPESAEMVRQALFSARERQGLTVVVVSHDRDWLDSVCDDMYHLGQESGIVQLVSEGRPCEP
jgi:tungstate transport system ATP-binding protein